MEVFQNISEKRILDFLNNSKCFYPERPAEMRPIQLSEVRAATDIYLQHGRAMIPSEIPESLASILKRVLDKRIIDMGVRRFTANDGFGGLRLSNHSHVQFVYMYLFAVLDLKSFSKQ
jgi:hypothetical protein